jgi:hypothetical protein
MTLAEQGAYRNLLDELWLRDGLIPNDDRILAKISGDAVEWPKVRENVLKRFRLVDGEWRNETHDGIRKESKRLAEKQARYRDRVTGNVTSDVTRSPSPSPSLRTLAIPVGREVVEPRRNEQPPRLPADIAEASVLNEIRKLQNELAGRLARLSEHPNSREMVSSWSRRATSYTRKDGTKVQGVSDYRTISSIERLERSIADADRWLQRLDEGPLEEAKSGIR